MIQEDVKLLTQCAAARYLTPIWVLTLAFIFSLLQAIRLLEHDLPLWFWLVTAVWLLLLLGLTVMTHERRLAVSQLFTQPERIASIRPLGNLIQVEGTNGRKFSIRAKPVRQVGASAADVLAALSRVAPHAPPLP